MGLSGRKVKQRIGNDPRNLSWANDAARFGSNYLAKFGWDSSKGLGVGGEGRISHIKVDHKLDMLGIGAAHQGDPNGIAWKQNKDFENLLKRLNENVPSEVVAESGSTEVKVEIEVRQTGDDNRDQRRSEKKEKGRKRDEDGKKEKQKKKRKHESDSDITEEEILRKRKKVERRRHTDSADAIMEGATTSIAIEAPTPTSKPVVSSVHRHRAHRARAIAAKNISSKSSAHISEILGIAPTPSTSTHSSASTTPLDQGKITSMSDVPEIEKLRTSAKSVADYFKEKLLAKSASKSGAMTPATSEPTSRSDKGDEYDTPRRGLGASCVRLEIKQDDAVEETVGVGLLKFSSLVSSTSFSAMSSSSFTQSATLSSKLEELDQFNDDRDEVKESGRALSSKDIEAEIREEREKRKAERRERKKKKARQELQPTEGNKQGGDRRTGDLEGTPNPSAEGDIENDRQAKKRQKKLEKAEKKARKLETTA